MEQTNEIESNSSHVNNSSGNQTSIERTSSNQHDNSNSQNKSKSGYFLHDRSSTPDQNDTNINKKNLNQNKVVISFV